MINNNLNNSANYTNTAETSRSAEVEQTWKSAVHTPLAASPATRGTYSAALAILNGTQGTQPPVIGASRSSIPAMSNQQRANSDARTKALNQEAKVAAHFQRDFRQMALEKLRQQNRNRSTSGPHATPKPPPTSSANPSVTPWHPSTPPPSDRRRNDITSFLKQRSSSSPSQVAGGPPPSEGILQRKVTDLTKFAQAIRAKLAALPQSIATAISTKSAPSTTRQSTVSSPQSKPPIEAQTPTKGVAKTAAPKVSTPDSTATEEIKQRQREQSKPQLFSNILSNQKLRGSFLLGYRSFLGPNGFFKNTQEMFREFHQYAKENNNLPEFHQFLHEWLNNNEFNCGETRNPELNLFLQGVLEQDKDKLGIQGETDLAKLTEQPTVSVSESPPISPNAPNIDTLFDKVKTGQLDQASIDSFANDLTSLSSHYFSKVTLKELQEGAYETKNKDKPSATRNCINHFQGTSNLVRTQLEAADATSETQLLNLTKFYGEVMTKCLEYRDFNSLAGIYFGLPNSARKLLENDPTFQEVSRLMDVSGGQKNIREAMSTGPCIPFLGPLCGQLDKAKAQEANNWGPVQAKIERLGDIFSATLLNNRTMPPPQALNYSGLESRTQPSKPAAQRQAATAA